jgi:hypothetical protein
MDKEKTRYLENNPVACDEIVRAAQGGTHPRPLPTPAPIPHNSDTPGIEAPTYLPPQYAIQEKLEFGTSPCIRQRNGGDLAGAHHGLSGASHGQSSTTQQGHKDGKQISNETCVNDSRFEKVMSKSQDFEAKPTPEHGIDVGDEYARSSN